MNELYSNTSWFNETDLPGLISPGWDRTTEGLFTPGTC